LNCESRMRTCPDEDALAGSRYTKD
jgi:hypothetical protein